MVGRVGGERAVDPPALVPADLFVSPARTFPGGLSVFDPQILMDAQINQPIFPWPVATQLPIGRDMQYDYRQMVEAALTAIYPVSRSRISPPPRSISTFCDGR